MEVTKYRKNQIVFGIDLGTSSLSCTGYNMETGRSVKFYDSQRMSFSTKVAICKNTGEVICGRQILASLDNLFTEYVVIDSIRSALKNSRGWQIANKNYQAEDIIAILLVNLKKAVQEKTRGILLQKAVFSIANDFTAAERVKLRKAAGKADIEITQMIHESIAAVYNSYEKIKEKKTILVIDWGASSIDLTVFTNVHKSLTEQLSVSKKVGGNDIDYQLAQLVHNDLLQTGNEVKSFAEIEEHFKQKLINKCEAAKRILAKRPMAELSLTYYGNTIGLRRHISNEELAVVIQPILTMAENFIRKTLNRFEISLDQVQAVLAVGGNFYLEGIRKAFKEMWKDKIIFSDNSSWSVSEGAAKLAVINGVYVTTTPLYTMLSDGTMFELIADNQDIDLIEKEFNFAIVEDCDQACFVFCDALHKQIGYLTVPVYGFFLEKISVDIWCDNNNIIHIRACSDRKANKDAKEMLYSFPNLKYKLPEIVS